MRRFVTPLLALALFAGGCSRTTIRTGAEGQNVGLVVTGIGRVEARPDTLAVSIGVESRRTTVAEALEAVSDGARAMLRAINAEGVENRDIRTTELNTFPEHDNQGNIVGFVATEMFRVRIRDLDKAGEVVGAAVAAAGDDARVTDMALEVADPEGAKEAARKRAVEDALRRAEELAETAGIDLGPPISIRETRGEEPRAFELPTAPRLEGVSVIADLAPRIEPGIQEILVRVVVRFEIRE